MNLAEIDLGTEPYRSYLWGVLYFLETLTETPHEAIRDRLEEIPRADWPTEFFLVAHERRQLDASDIDIGSMLDGVIEELDSEHGDPEGNYDTWEESPEVAAAALKLAEEIAKAYDPYICDEVERFKVNVLDWVKANRPDWLTEDGRR